MVFSPNGKTLATGGGDQVNLYDMSFGKLTATLPHKGGITSLAFSPDGKLLASVATGTIKLWQICPHLGKGDEPMSMAPQLTMPFFFSVHFVTSMRGPEWTRMLKGDLLLHVGAEPLWLIKAPKHSTHDVVTVFRGVAMTGDIELGTLASVNEEVSPALKKRSMRWLHDFSRRTGYHIHSVFSAHLNDVRLFVNWPDLFVV